jgi:hypothetical protein
MRLRRWIGEGGNLRWDSDSVQRLRQLLQRDSGRHTNPGRPGTLGDNNHDAVAKSVLPFPGSQEMDGADFVPIPLALSQVMEQGRKGGQDTRANNAMLRDGNHPQKVWHFRETGDEQTKHDVKDEKPDDADLVSALQIGSHRKDGNKRGKNDEYPKGKRPAQPGTGSHDEKPRFIPLKLDRGRWKDHPPPSI